ncbi:peptidase [Methyloceanibacter marginalis]|uniref:Peptidase n=1 Tax=Methyloceanibacter marginalis TaxID=1774971 RepID=A0A1E3VPI7_9HYPH|nr:PepSY domain-containing protein [Methyloceanibacter marginalis]ODR95455.1 peptidase [Methyloceanibacter marginalis]
MTNKALRQWSWVHKWTSLVCTLFLLLLCVTGLPLVFYHEIEHVLGNEVEAPEIENPGVNASLDTIVTNSKAHFPGKQLQYLSWDEEEPALVYAGLGDELDSEDGNRYLALDARTGEALGEIPFQGTVMFYVYRLHVDIFAGLAGKLFLGFMGLLFVASIVSGIVVYSPSMRKLDFGSVRHHRPRAVRWLDLHNLLGIVLAAWMIVVGGTGASIRGRIWFSVWRNDQLTEMLGAHKDNPRPETPASLETAIQTARDKVPGMIPSFVAFPGTLYSSTGHYTVFMHGDTPLTSKLLQPVVIDAATGDFTDTREMPWYVTTLLISQPLHFGDYGGMPLKILWAILDVITIVVLVTGLYLWFRRRRPNAANRFADDAEIAPRYAGAPAE